MNRLQFFTIAVLSAALSTPVTVWGADGPEGSSGTPDQPTELTRLKAQLEQQQKQIEALQRVLEQQQKLLEKAIGEKSAAGSAEAAVTGGAAAPAAGAVTPPATAAVAPLATATATPPATAGAVPLATATATPPATTTTAAAEPDHKAPNLGDVASAAPIIPQGVAPALPPVSIPIAAIPQVVPPPGTAQEQIPESPLQLRIGNTAITPVGFMDLTNTFRSTASGAGLMTNFGNYPYNNNLPTGRLTEDRMSAQNSRIGLRTDTLYKDWHILGYFESDFVGGVGDSAYNTQVSSYSMLLRLRLYWVSARKSKYEFLAGQSWSLMTPNRRQISALPGDLFYGLEMDVNYLNGLTWGRIPGYRFIYHPSDKVTWAIAAENGDQYFGGSGGGGVPTLPAALSGLTSNELDANVANGLTKIANWRPDIISKLAFDPLPQVHFEFAGVTNGVKIFNPNSPPALGAGQTFTSNGVGGSFNGNFEVIPNFRLITNNFWSDGDGRYLFGVAPDFIIRSNGSPSMMHSGSTVDGFELTLGKATFYTYYGGIYIGRDTALDANGTTLIGYGYHGSANSQNRSTQEITAGWNQIFFRDPKYGQVSTFLQWAYFWRNPWYLAPNAPKDAFQNAVWFDVRYTLPGSAPTIGN
jgi:hypothetical protein